MAEVEVGGIKFTGGKMTAVLVALSTAAGIVWGAAEFYGDYMDMKERIEAYESPDLSHIEKGIAVNAETMKGQQEQIKIHTEKLDFMADDIRANKSEMRDVQKRLYTLETETQKDLIEVRKLIRESIREALENPLANQ
jgi:hypothetical protein